MQATNVGYMHIDGLVSRAMGSIRSGRYVPRASFSLPSFFWLATLLACTLCCAPPASQGGGSRNSTSSASDSLELTDDMIHERINDARVRDVPEENGTAEPISWGFDENEPKVIAIIEKQLEGDRATIVLDIKTSSSPRSREQRYLAGQIRTEWELKTGWALRQWEIVSAENISMKYRNIITK